MRINIIGDIAGRFDQLQELLSIMPEADLVIAVGDLVDRGPKSKQVIEYFMNTPKTIALYGNHEQLMERAYITRYYGDWVRNGGAWTVKSYAPTDDTPLTLDLINPDHIEWLKTLPMYYETDHLFVSHAPVNNLMYIPTDPYGRDHYFIWNRYEPLKPQHKFMVHGHNGIFQEYKKENGEVYGMCIDHSHKYKLMGMHWPTKEVFSVDEPIPPGIILDDEE